jgi:hypothetical protein
MYAKIYWSPCLRSRSNLCQFSAVQFPFCELTLLYLRERMKIHLKDDFKIKTLMFDISPQIRSEIEYFDLSCESLTFTLH